MLVVKRLICAISKSSSKVTTGWMISDPQVTFLLMVKLEDVKIALEDPMVKLENLTLKLEKVKLWRNKRKKSRKRRKKINRLRKVKTVSLSLTRMVTNLKVDKMEVTTNLLVAMD